jgi:hypothetical protein
MKRLFLIAILVLANCLSCVSPSNPPNLPPTQGEEESRKYTPKPHKESEPESRTRKFGGQPIRDKECPE